MRECIVKARDLRKIYTRGAEEIGAVRGVDLEVNSGDFIAIMGPSGSGKTTLLDLIGCLENPSGGRLEVLGRDISEVPAANNRRQHGGQNQRHQGCDGVVAEDDLNREDHAGNRGIEGGGNSCRSAAGNEDLESFLAKVEPLTKR